MVYGLWLSADGLLAQQYRQDVIANNLANVDTPGFKPDRVAFAERLTESMLGGVGAAAHSILDSGTGGLFGRPVYTDFDAAGTIESGSPLDVAVLGDGFLAVSTPDGIQYTRDGRLVMDTNGTLRHASSGGAILDERERPVVVDPISKAPIKIDRAGLVSQGENLIGRLALVDFENRQALEKAGQNLYNAERARAIEVNGEIRQYAYEASGVQPASTLVDMIAASRAYEMNVSMISMQDESLGRAVNEVGRIG